MSMSGANIKVWPPNDWVFQARSIAQEKERLTQEAAAAKARQEEVKLRRAKELARKKIAQRELTQEEAKEQLNERVQIWKHAKYEEELKERRGSNGHRGFALAPIQHTSWGKIKAPNTTGYTAGATRPHLAKPINFRTVSSFVSAPNKGIDHTRAIIETLFKLVSVTYSDHEKTDQAARYVVLF